VWQDDDGVTLAYGWVALPWLWIAWPGIAAYRFAAGSDDPVVTAFPDREGKAGPIEDVFRRVIQPIALQARGYEALHASAVLMPRGAVAFCARTKTGKSTIAFALANRGYIQLADDSVVLEFGAKSIAVVPLPFQPRLQPPALYAAVGGENNPGAFLVDLPSRAPLGAIVRRNRAAADDPGPVARVAPLAQARRFPSVLAHAHCFDLASRDSRGRLLEHYLDLVGAVPVLELTFHPGFDRLPAVLDTLLRAIDPIDATNAGVPPSPRRRPHTDGPCRRAF